MKQVLLIFQMICLIFISGCAVTNKFEEYRGKVVEKGTNEPIDGAAVLAVYYTRRYTLAGSSNKYVDLQETITDKNGEFVISPKRIFTFRPLHSSSDYPQFTIFKSGYGCYPEHKEVGPFFRPSGTLPKDKHVEIELPKLKMYEDRRNNQRCGPSPSVPKDKYPVFTRELTRERKILGID